MVWILLCNIYQIISFDGCIAPWKPGEDPGGLAMYTRMPGMGRGKTGIYAYFTICLWGGSGGEEGDYASLSVLSAGEIILSARYTAPATKSPTNQAYVYRKLKKCGT